MLDFLLRIVVLSVASITAGCYHARIVAASDTEDYGETVHTRFHYRLICDEDEDIDAGMTTVQKFRMYQPDVFAEDGIPIELSFKDKLTDEFGVWTDILLPMSCALIPNGRVSHRHRLCSISTAGEHLSSVEMCARKSSSLALSPLPLLIFAWDDTSCFSGGKEFKVHSYDYLDELRTPFQNIDEMAMAYGIAARLKKAEDSGKIDERFATVAMTAQSLSDAATTQAKMRAYGTFAMFAETGDEQPFEIVRCDNEKKKDFAYEFTLRKRGGGLMSLSDYSVIRTAFRSAIRSHYMSSHPETNPRTLVIDFTKYELSGDVVSGRVAILTISPESIAYDSESRRGVISVQIGDGQFEDARRWIRRNLSALAARSNIVFDGDAVPQGARFYSESEEMHDGILKVSFKTE